MKTQIGIRYSVWIAALVCAGQLASCSRKSDSQRKTDNNDTQINTDKNDDQTQTDKTKGDNDQTTVVNPIKSNPNGPCISYKSEAFKQIKAQEAAYAIEAREAFRKRLEQIKQEKGLTETPLPLAQNDFSGDDLAFEACNLNPVFFKDASNGLYHISNADVPPKRAKNTHTYFICGSGVNGCGAVQRLTYKVDPTYSVKGPLAVDYEVENQIVYKYEDIQNPP